MPHHAIEIANLLGTRWAAWIASATMDSIVLLAAVSLLWLAIRRRAAPQVGYCLFLLVSLRLLSPIEISVPSRIAQWIPSQRLAAWLTQNPRAPESAVAPAETRVTAQPPSVLDRAVAAPIHVLPSYKVVQLSEQPSLTAANALSQPPAATTVIPLHSAAALMLGWLAIVALLVTRFAWAQLSFAARIRRAPTADDPQLIAEFCALCARAGLRPTVRLVQCHHVSSPAAWGLFRPTIILPVGMQTALSQKQLRWVLLHELAHLKRHDLWAMLVQRLAAILNFFNPAIWIANRAANHLRECDCDDFATLLSEGTGIESSEAFVKLLRDERQSQRSLEGALGIFGLDSRAACFARVRRMLDTDRPRRARLSWLASSALLLAATVALPHLRAASGDSDVVTTPGVNSQAAPPARKSTSDVAKRTFQLSVLGPDGKPLPGITIDCRTYSKFKPEQVLQGKFVRKNPWGADIRLDEHGQTLLKLPKNLRRFDIYVEARGYGPYWAGWDADEHPDPIPPAFVAKLDSGWTIGGIMVDESGTPIHGATVHPSIEYKKRPGLSRQLGTGDTARTNAKGEWHYDSVPVGLSKVYVEIEHPKFAPLSIHLERPGFEIKAGAKPTARITMSRGLTVSGTVNDEAGHPIAGAHVRAKFRDDIREARSGADGKYELAGCQPAAARIVAWAKGHATDMQELVVGPNPPPVDFKMKSGGHVRIRVLDAQGKPVPRARIFFQRWRGEFSYFEFDDKSQYADKNGVWMWNEAPPDEFEADVSGGEHDLELTNQKFIARKDEYVVRLPAQLVFVGKVVDAETQKPIDKFRVIPGLQSRDEELQEVQWIYQQAFEGLHGRFELRQHRQEKGYAIRIEADGYSPVESRILALDDSNIPHNFALDKGKNVATTVLQPDGKPAANAIIALGVRGSQIWIKNGGITGIEGGTYCDVRTTDVAGRFAFWPKSAPFQLFITQQSGFAHLKINKWPATLDSVHLTPWARVEGTYRAGGKPQSVPITIDSRSEDTYGGNIPHMFTSHETTSDADGHFVFERVIPGKGRIGRVRSIPEKNGGWMEAVSAEIAEKFVADQTMHVEVNEAGQIVVGRLQSPEGHRVQLLWNVAKITATADGHTLPKFSAMPDAQGRFQFDPIPPGDYVLRVVFNSPDVKLVANERFAVKANPPAQPLDLGSIKLKSN